MKKMCAFIGVFILFVIFSIQYANLIRNTVDLQDRSRNSAERKSTEEESGIDRTKSETEKTGAKIYKPKNSGLKPGSLERPVAKLKICSEVPSEYVEYKDLNMYMEAEGGKPPFKWKIVEGQLPDGVLFFDKGKFDRYPTTAGEYHFKIQVKDSTGQTDVKAFFMRIYTELIADYLSNQPPPMELNVKYVYRILFEGGKGPYGCAVLKKNLPMGVNYNVETYTISGTPEEFGNYSLEIEIYDALNQTTNWNWMWDVEEPEPGTEPKDPVKPKDTDTPKPPQTRPRRPGINNEIIRKLAELSQEAIRLLKQKKFKEAIVKYEEILKLEEDNMNALYNLACCYSLMNEKVKALEYLEKAMQAGFVDETHIKQDKDLDNIRETPKFKKLMNQLDVLKKDSVKREKLQLKREFPESQGYHILVDHENKFILSTNIGDNKKQCIALLELVKDRINNYAAFLWSYLFKNKPDFYIKVVLPKKLDFNIYMRSKGFSTDVVSWYKSSTHFLISSSIGGNLTFLITHALHLADLAEMKTRAIMKIWFKDGLASCFENCQLPEKKGEKATPVHNNRLRIAQQYAASNRLPWRQFFMMPQGNFMRNAAACQACARYITFWLLKKKKLKDFYNAYAKGWARDRAGIAAMEKVFAKSLEQIEAEWKTWMSNERPKKPEAFLGIQLAAGGALATGMRIYKVFENTGAEKAGLKAGDIISMINRMTIENQDNLRQAIASSKIGNKVKVVIFRDGFPKTFTVKLGKRPD